MTATQFNNFAANLPNLGLPVAESGDSRDPIDGSSNTTDTRASLKYGLPYLMSQPVSGSGIPVPRQDLNGMFNLLSKLTHFLMAGGKIGWSSAEATAIDGYPTGAEVQYNGHTYVSKADNNLASPTDTTKWDVKDNVLSVFSVKPTSHNVGFAPDYSSRVDISPSYSSYTVQDYGYIQWIIHSGNRGTKTLTIDSVTVVSYTSDYGLDTYLIPVKPGMVISWTNSTSSGDGCWFVPYV